MFGTLRTTGPAPALLVMIAIAVPCCLWTRSSTASADRPVVNGKFVEFSAGELSVDVVQHAKGKTHVEHRTFEVPRGTPVIIHRPHAGSSKTISPLGFQGVEPGSRVIVTLGPDENVIRVAVDVPTRGGE